MLVIIVINIFIDICMGILLKYGINLIESIKTNKANGVKKNPISNIILLVNL